MAMRRGDGAESGAAVRLAELMAALSLATDLGMGQPLEFALRSLILAMRLGDALGMDEVALREVYYQALLRYIGCNAETSLLAAVFGDELAMRADYATVDAGKSEELLRFVIRRTRAAHAGAGPLQMARYITEGLMSRRQTQEGFLGHCEVAQRLARRLGLGDGSVRALGQVYARWDGKGTPALRGDEVAPAALVVALAQDAVTFLRLGGVEAAVAVARERAGTAYEPGMAARFIERAPHLLAGLEDEPTWETALALEPGPRLRLSDDQFDTACQAIADFADIKSPYTLGHSTGVAALAASAARACGLPDGDVEAIQRAGWLHDVGRVGVPAAIWEKPGPLAASEWERVRLHPYYTQRILARPGALAALAAVAAASHERLDGSGYHRGAGAASLTPAARILAAADVYHAMTEERPHRSAHPPEAAADALRREARAGRLDADAVAGVLAAAGHQAGPSSRRGLVAGLSEREVEVLRLLARGATVKQIARALVIAPKTADNHVQHIYAKIGVSTRAGATLFAMEQRLLTPAT
jgi:HD-GYP domain-containing protein (c-di-GMP phosphodiesterase class II)